MSQLSFPDGIFDLIWSEGAIYLMGMENGLKRWNNFSKPDGFIAFSEISWFLDNPPDELSKYWKVNYPPLKSISQNLESIKNLGFTILDHFSLPENNWIDNYYSPLLEKIKHLQESHDIDENMEETINETYTEFELYRKYSKWYGYEFYIVQKTNKK